MVPLEEAVLRHLAAPLAPFCTTTGLRFGEGDLCCGSSDSSSSSSDSSDQESGGSSTSGGAGGGGGAWRNFFVGVVGGVGAVEEEVLWPNQVGGKKLLSAFSGWRAGGRVLWL